MKNRTLILNLLVLISITALNAKNASAFKPAMHAKTANVAIYDALDGGICLPGLGGEVWLGNTELQHLVEVEEGGETRLEYRNYFLQYAPHHSGGFGRTRCFSRSSNGPIVHTRKPCARSRPTVFNR